jgi:DNA-binding transcriptional ArsR family regulator
MTITAEMERLYAKLLAPVAAKESAAARMQWWNASTSRAFRAVAPETHTHQYVVAQKRRDAVMSLLADGKPRTAGEVAAALDADHKAIAYTLSTLWVAGLVTDAGKRRLPNKRFTTVYAAAGARE